MNIFSNLCTASNGCPRIYHGSRIYICANIYIRWHHNDSRGYISAIPCYGMWHDTNPKFFIICFECHFIVKLKRAYLYGFHLANGEIHDHCFFDPFIYNPFLSVWFSNTYTSLIDSFNYFFDNFYGRWFL